MVVYYPSVNSNSSPFGELYPSSHITFKAQFFRIILCHIDLKMSSILIFAPLLTFSKYYIIEFSARLSVQFALTFVTSNIVTECLPKIETLMRIICYD